MWASSCCQECGVVLINLEEQDLCPFRWGSGADRSELCLWFPVSDTANCGFMAFVTSFLRVHAELLKVKKILTVRNLYKKEEFGGNG